MPILDPTLALTSDLQLAEAVGVELVREELIGQYVQLLKDNEAEVRTAAAGQIPGELLVNFRCLAHISMRRLLQASRQRSHPRSNRTMCT
jgi:serine/threonine-protein phosphatase 2A regulatory subunit A